MIISTLKESFNRDLAKLKSEIEQYREEEKIWYIERGIANSAGNLCLHLIGNLKTFIGAELGGSSYVRNREFEFSGKNVPRAKLVEEIEETARIVDATLGQLTEAQLQADCPVQFFDKIISTEFFLLHLATHLAYHLGQINYHRRLLDD